MLVRGAPLIGATAAYGMALAVRDDRSDAGIDRAYELLIATRPTAINLKWALDEMKRVLRPAPPSERAQIAYARAAEIAEEDVAINEGDRPAWPGADRTDRGGEAARRASQRPDPLQRRLARDGGLGHGDGADLSGA